MTKQRKPARSLSTYRQHRSLRSGKTTSRSRSKSSDNLVVKYKSLVPKLEILVWLALFIVVSFWALDVGGRPHIRIQPTSPFIGLAEVSQLEGEVHQLIHSTRLGNLQPFIPRSEIQELLEGKSYVTTSNISIDILASRLDIVITPERPFAILTTEDSQEYVLTTAGRVIEGFSASDAPKDAIRIDDPLYVSSGAIRGKGAVLSKEAVRFLLDLGCFLGNPDSGEGTSYTSCSKLPGAPKLKLDRVELTTSPRQLDVYLSGGGLGTDTKVVMSTDRSAISQGIALVQSLDFFTSDDRVLPSEYIDVRLVYKVIYR